MNKRLKAKWVKALRSGKYQQGRGVLYHPTDQTYCCLGVLAEVAGCKWHDNIPYKGGRRYSHSGSLLTDEAADDLGLRHPDKWATRNDGNAYEGIKPWSFSRIAAAIARTKDL